jgi:hypothetical protein
MGRHGQRTVRRALSSGLPEDAAPLFSKRMSFCCGVRDCRVRATPPSVVFSGRCFSHGAIVLLVSLVRI